MLASALLRNGVGRITEILDELQFWMEKYEYQSIGQMKGSMSQQAVSDPSAFERANYMKALVSFDNRVRY
jgi:dihydroorotate dehydrogenase (fumarate)